MNKEVSFAKVTYDIIDKIKSSPQSKLSNQKAAELIINLKNAINQNAGEFQILKSSRYLRYLKQDFIPNNYKSIYPICSQFFDLLQLSGYVTLQESQELFSVLMKERKEDLIRRWRTEKRPVTQKKEWMTEMEDLDEIFRGILDDEKRKIRDARPQIEKVWEEFSKLFHLIDFMSMGLKNVRLVMYGSFQNMFQTAKSDIDFTLLTDCYVDERVLIKVVKEYFDEFKKKGMFQGEIKKRDETHVRIPCLVFEYKGVEFDMTINNIFSVFNSNLLNTYAKVDDRCKDLGILVKLWTKAKNICDGQKWLSSYCYLLMMINFLQVIEKPILPSLQKLATFNLERNKLKRTLDMQTEDNQDVNFAFEKDIKKIRMTLKQENNLRLSELFIFFINWLEELATSGESTINIKEGCLIPREERLEINMNDASKNPRNFVFSVDDPFDQSHNLGKNFRKQPGQKNENVENFLEKLKGTIESLKSFCLGGVTTGEIKKIFVPKESSLGVKNGMMMV